MINKHINKDWDFSFDFQVNLSILLLKNLRIKLSSKNFKDIKDNQNLGNYTKYFGFEVATF